MFETEKVFTNVDESNQEKVTDEGYHSPYRASFGRVLGTGRLRGHDIPDSDEERGNHFECERLRYKYLTFFFCDNRLSFLFASPLPM